MSERYNIDIETVQWWVTLLEFCPDEKEYQQQYNDLANNTLLDSQGIMQVNEYIAMAGEGERIDIATILAESQARRRRM